MIKKMTINPPAKVPHIPTTAELVEEQIEEVIASTLDLLDERLFYVYDKYSDYNAEEFSEFVKRGTDDLDKRIVEKVKDWDGGYTNDDADLGD